MQSPLQVYRNEVWMLLHKTDTPEKETAVVRLYLDESGGADPNTPQAVIAGMLINRSHYLHFEECWDTILERHGINPPLHMNEFGKNGRFEHVVPSIREALFKEIVELIKSHCIATLAAILTNSEYEIGVAAEIRNKFSVYGMCFNLMIMMNHKLAEGRFEHAIPVIFDAGNPFAEHVRQVHAAALEIQKETFLHVGGLYFDDDAQFGVLQAADVIAWGVRRIASGKPFPVGLEPIQNIFTGGHNENSWKPEWLKQLSDALLSQIVARKQRAEQRHDEEF